MMIRLFSRLCLLRKGERGDGNIITLLTIIVISMFVGYGSIDFKNVSTIRNTMTSAANETLQYIKTKNGDDGTARIKFDSMIRTMGMNPSNISFRATPQMVQRGQPVEIEVSRPYKIYMLSVLGIDYTTTVDVHVTGLVSKYMR